MVQCSDETVQLVRFQDRMLILAEREMHGATHLLREWEFNVGGADVTNQTPSDAARF